MPVEAGSIQLCDPDSAWSVGFFDWAVFDSGLVIAGVAAYVKAYWPEVQVIGVEPDDAPTLARALAAGERVVLDQVGIFADGVAVRQVGAEPFRVCRDTVDEVVLVTGDEICAAIKDIFDDTRSIAEPAGALAVAGLKRYVERTGVSGEALVAIDSGARDVPVWEGIWSLPSGDAWARGSVACA